VFAGLIYFIMFKYAIALALTAFINEVESLKNLLATQFTAHDDKTANF